MRWSLLAGLIFGLGLGVSGMTDPMKVIGFLDVTEAWDPSLALVMAGAVGTHAIGYRWVRARRATPALGGLFKVPSRGAPIDRQLIFGALVFGVGWGMAGYCPGPAVVSAASGSLPALVFVLAMAAGMVGYRYTADRHAGGPARDECG